MSCAFCGGFGFVGANASAETAYDAIMTAADDFDADDLFETALANKKHWAQNVCTYAQARCASCPLSDICLQRLEAGAIMAMPAPACVA